MVSVEGLLSRPNRRHWWTLLLVALAMLSAVAALTAETVRSTVLERRSYDRVLQSTHAVDRLYSDVLPDRAAAPVTQDLLARIPFDPSLITANLRVVLPPATVRGLVDQEVDGWLAYLSGRRDDLDLTVDLTPVFGNIADLANTYVSRALTDRPTYQSGSIRTVTSAVLGAVSALASGQLPALLPTLDLTPGEARLLSAAIVAKVPASLGADATSRLAAELVKGDLPGALAVVGPALLGNVRQASGDLGRRLGAGATLDLSVPLGPLNDTALGATGRLVHDVAPALTWLIVGFLLLSVLALLAAGRVAGWTRVALLRRGTIALLTAVVSAAVVAALVRLYALHALNAFNQRPSQLGPAARRLIDDLGQAYIGEVQRRFLLLAAAIVLVIVAAAVLDFAARRVRAARRAGRRLTWRSALLTTLPAVLLGSGLLTAAQSAPAAALLCNGHAELCDRPYDQVSYLAAHNAMANSEDRFLGPAQDPSMIHQLDQGVRTLLIDTHYWTSPPDVERFLTTLSPSTRAVLAPIARVATYQRPGAWLCHDICQLGASPLRDQMTALRNWVQRNPNEIITLVIEDHTASADTIDAVSRSGLGAYALTPPEAAQGPWPTLRQMIERQHRVVILSENHDVPGGWLRNFFRYASDTPFDVRDPQTLACRLNRGRG